MNWWGLIGGLVVLCVAYGPSVVHESLWADDYPYLVFALEGESAIFAQPVSQGRPLHSLLLHVGFIGVDAPYDLWILRLLALAGLLLLLVLIAWQGTSFAHRNLAVFSMAIAFLLPSFVFFVQWNIYWTHTWGLVANLSGWILWARRSLRKRILGIILVCASLLLYPPLSVFFFAWIGVTAALKPVTWRVSLRQLASAVVLFILAAFLAGIIALLSLKLTGVERADRVEVLNFSDIPAQMAWLISRPVVTSLRLFAIDSPSLSGVIVSIAPTLLILLLGLAFQSRYLHENFLVRGGTIVLALAVTLLPLAIVPEQIIEHRTIPGLAWGLAVLTIFSLLRGITLVFISVTPSMPTSARTYVVVLGIGILMLPTALLVLHVQDRYWSLIGDPYDDAQEFFAAAMSRCKSPITEVVIVPPNKPFPMYRRLGSFSLVTDLSLPWVPENAVRIQLLTRGSQSIRTSDATKLAAGATPPCVIQLGEYQTWLKAQMDVKTAPAWSLRYKNF